jgi:hypothetical protein
VERVEFSWFGFSLVRYKLGRGRVGKRQGWKELSLVSLVLV